MDTEELYKNLKEKEPTWAECLDWNKVITQWEKNWTKDGKLTAKVCSLALITLNDDESILIDIPDERTTEDIEKESRLKLKKKLLDLANSIEE
jgi:hypothetical protein